jgi:uncharacterized protein YbaA (DUF1428 family)
MPFTDITVMPVPTGSKAAHLAHAIRVAALFKDHGASAVTNAGARRCRTARSPTSRRRSR